LHSAQAAAKAKFFADHGFSETGWPALKGALLNHPMANAASSVTATAFGMKYEVTCSLKTPDGRDPCIISIWIVEPPDRDPRFVTAYPNPP
jgi:hypothetical protein